MKKNLLLVIIFAAIVGLFLFWRFYQLSTYLEFFGDVGRDLHELTLMVEERKPTLLGPGISFLPLNQSPIYYYALLPVFLLSGRSPYTAMISFSLIYVLMFIVGTIMLRKNKLHLKSLLAIGYLVALHPEFIHQLRNPWNPSLAPPFIFMALFAFLYLKQKFNWPPAAIFSLGLALALGMTVSILPSVVVLLAYLAFLYRKQARANLKIFSLFFLSLIGVFLPVIIFEIRHNFFFIRRLLLGDPFLSGQPEIAQNKLLDLTRFLSGSTTSFWIILVIMVVLISLVGNLWLAHKHKFAGKAEQNFLMFLGLFISSTLLTLLMPFTLHAHYIFGLLALLFMTLAQLKTRLLLPLLLVLSAIWLHPAQINRHFTLPRRTVEQMVSCMEKTCANLSGPTFVTAQAWHEYHSALEYTYLLNRAGCSARNIIQHPDFANTMVVVADNSRYDHNQTTFNELAVFGPAVESKTFACDSDLSVHILEPL